MPFVAMRGISFAAPEFPAARSLQPPVFEDLPRTDWKQKVPRLAGESPAIPGNNESAAPGQLIAHLKQFNPSPNPNHKPQTTNHEKDTIPSDISPKNPRSGCAGGFAAARRRSEHHQLGRVQRPCRGAEHRTQRDHLQHARLGAADGFGSDNKPTTHRSPDELRRRGIPGRSTIGSDTADGDPD